MASFIEKYGKNGTRSQVTGGLMQELEQHEDGLGGMFDAFEQNGIRKDVARWASGETQPTLVRRIDKAFRGTNIIANRAERIHVSPVTVMTELAILLPILVHHFVLSGFVTTNNNFQYESTVLKPHMMLASALDRVM